MTYKLINICMTNVLLPSVNYPWMERNLLDILFGKLIDKSYNCFLCIFEDYVFPI